MAHRSADEVRAEFVRSFPPGTGELADELSSSISYLHLKWKLYRAFFGTSAERIDLLNETAPALFGHLGQIMFNDVVLAITRLTDPAGDGDRENASLARLIKLLALQADAELKGWRSKLAIVNKEVEPLRQIRNRFLAHEDLATALNNRPQPPGSSRAMVESLLERIRGLFNSIEDKFLGSHTSYELIIADGGEQLIDSLEQAVRHRSHR